MCSGSAGEPGELYVDDPKTARALHCSHCGWRARDPCMEAGTACKLSILSSTLCCVILVGRNTRHYKASVFCVMWVLEIRACGRLS